jgi:D-aminopeptidase
VFQDKVPGAVFVGNAFGKLAGSTQVDELGTIETPIGLTNTLSVGAVMEGLVRWTLDQAGNDNVRSVNALVGETNDGGLNDIRGQHVRPQHAIDALKAATTGAVQEGSVGAGTGTQAFGWKGGIGTSSRSSGALRRLHDWRAGAIELRRRIDDGRRAGRQNPRRYSYHATSAGAG